MNPVELKPLLDATVALLTGYMTYRASVKPSDPSPAHAQEAEKALATVQQTIEHQGNDDDRADWQSFQRNPERYQDQLKTMLNNLIEQNPNVAQELQNILATLPKDPASGRIHIVGNVYGPVVDENNAPIDYVYNANPKDEAK